MFSPCLLFRFVPLVSGGTNGDNPAPHIVDFPRATRVSGNNKNSTRKAGGWFGAVFDAACRRLPTLQRGVSDAPSADR